MSAIVKTTKANNIVPKYIEVTLPPIKPIVQTRAPVPQPRAQAPQPRAPAPQPRAQAPQVRGTSAPRGTLGGGGGCGCGRR